MLSAPTAGSAAPSGSWDSLHVFECHERGRSAKYKLTSTVILLLGTKMPTRIDVKGLEEANGESEVALSGSMTRQAEVDSPLPNSAAHIPNIGRMVEDME